MFGNAMVDFMAFNFYLSVIWVKIGGDDCEKGGFSSAGEVIIIKGGRIGAAVQFLLLESLEIIKNQKETTMTRIYVFLPQAR